MNNRSRKDIEEGIGPSIVINDPDKAHVKDGNRKDKKKDAKLDIVTEDSAMEDPSRSDVKNGGRKDIKENRRPSSRRPR